MPIKQTRVTVRPCANGFALIGADGQVIADGFKTPQLAWMRAGRKGLHKGKQRINRDTKIIPEAMADERIFGLPFYAALTNRPYQRFFLEAKRGEWGTLVRMAGRYLGIRWGDYQRSLTAREVQPTK